MDITEEEEKVIYATSLTGKIKGFYNILIISYISSYEPLSRVWENRPWHGI